MKQGYYKWLAVCILVLFSVLAIFGGGLLLWSGSKLDESGFFANGLRALIVGLVTMTGIILILKKSSLGYWVGLLSIIILFFNEASKLFNSESDKLFVVTEIILLFIAVYSLYKTKRLDVINSNGPFGVLKDDRT